MDEFMGIIKMFAGTYAPDGWAFCDGSILNIKDNAALFSILNTTYGGDGIKNFALPDLRGCVPLGMGRNPNRMSYSIGDNGGSENTVLLTSNLPPHSHTITCSNQPGNQADPTGNIPAHSGNSDKEYSNSSPTAAMAPYMVGTTGMGQPISVMQPYLAINYIICIKGAYPPRA
jgi:microcystin-dependent protein